ncbi:hypothetical protein KQI63_14565 [bacterium]|nr:hypothetical protein [bacterium]
MSRLAIHHRTASFSSRWIKECERRGIDHRVVNVYSPDREQQLADVDGFMWHWAQHQSRDLVMAIPILRSMQEKGVKVFPNIDTCWHFDDKVAQSILLEAIDAPCIPFKLFHSYRDVVKWSRTATWPMVFKLRRGAGSLNVRLVHNREEALRLARRMFSFGITPIAGPLADVRTRIRKSGGAKGLVSLAKSAPAGIMRVLRRKWAVPRERDYFYVQDYIPGNTHDNRVIVIGDRLFAHRRAMRPGDFRASGSGLNDFNPKHVHPDCLTISRDLADRLRAQSMVLDFLVTPEDKPLIVEISYVTIDNLVYQCEGYWDRAGNWHEGHFWPQDLLLDDMLAQLERGSGE